MTEARKQFYEDLHNTLKNEKKFDDVIKRIKVDKPKILNPDLPFYGAKGKK